MTVLPKTLLWDRLDTTGAEHVLLDDRGGLYARGTMLANDPVPHTARYSLQVDQAWASVRLEVTTEGAGWLRSVRLERAAGEWHVSAGEQGDLDAALIAAGRARSELPGCEEPERLVEALDVDLGDCPLTNTLPIRRLGLLGEAPGTSRTITAAWVLVPSLAVIPSPQTYTVLDERHHRYASGTFAADLTVDENGYVLHYPGLATATSVRSATPRR
ncbi:MAG: uncharacterized protein V7603_3605 [Micromonosporaceae bacterium]